MAALTGAGVFLLAFNPLHLWMRWWGLRTGYRFGSELNAFLSGSVLPKWRRLLASAGPSIALIFAIVAFTFARREFEAGWIAFLSSFVLMLGVLKMHRPLHLALSGVAAVCLLIAWVSFDK